MKKADFAALERRALDGPMRGMGFAPKAIFGTSEKAWVRSFEGGFEAVAFALLGYAPDLRIKAFLVQRHDAIARLVNPHFGFMSEKFERFACDLLVWPSDLGWPALDAAPVSTDEEARAVLGEAARFFEERAAPFFAGTRSVDEVAALYRRGEECTRRLMWPLGAMVGVAAARLTGAAEEKAWLAALVEKAVSANPLDEGRVQRFVAALA